MSEEIKPEIFERKVSKVAAVKVYRENCYDVVRWLRENDIPANVLLHANRIEFFITHRVTVKFGDWLIRSSEGNFAPCKDTYFKKNYQKAGL